jgi:hypothetical protein
MLVPFSETNSANGTKPDRNITRGTGTANPSGAPGFICFLVGSCIEDRQTIQWPKRERTKGQTMYYTEN